VAINDNVWRVGYGKKISNRMSFLGLVGPQLIYSAESGVPGTHSSTSVTGQATLTYNLQRVSFSGSYLHFVSPGSGIFQGANTDTLSAGVGAQLTRTWNLSLSVGGSRNSPLGAYSINPAFPHPGVVTYQYGSIRLTHIMGRYMRLFMVYNLQHQNSGAEFVPGSTSTKLFRSVFGAGVEFHPRPVGL
jgi:hypothetical protein